MKLELDLIRSILHQIERSPWVQIHQDKIIEENERLKDYIDNMCGMIEAETPLKEHDRWLDDCITQGFYKRDKE
jgi:hypothetical protein